MSCSLPLTISFSGQGLSMVHFCIPSYTVWYPVGTQWVLVELEEAATLWWVPYGSVSMLFWRHLLAWFWVPRERGSSLVHLCFPGGKNWSAHSRHSPSVTVNEVNSILSSLFLALKLRLHFAGFSKSLDQNGTASEFSWKTIFSLREPLRRIKQYWQRSCWEDHDWYQNSSFFFRTNYSYNIGENIQDLGQGKKSSDLVPPCKVHKRKTGKLDLIKTKTFSANDSVKVMKRQSTGGVKIFQTIYLTKD